MSAALIEDTLTLPFPVATVIEMPESIWYADFFDGQACNVCGESVEAWGVHTEWGYVHECCAHVVPADA